MLEVSLLAQKRSAVGRQLRHTGSEMRCKTVSMQICQERNDQLLLPHPSFQIAFRRFVRPTPCIPISHHTRFPTMPKIATKMPYPVAEDENSTLTPDKALQRLRYKLRKDGESRDRDLYKIIANPMT
jgi:hypothetical protein